MTPCNSFCYASNLAVLVTSALALKLMQHFCSEFAAQIVIELSSHSTKELLTAPPGKTLRRRHGIYLNRKELTLVKDFKILSF